MKSSRFVQLAMFAMVVFGCAETTFADTAYSFTTIDVPGALFTTANGINNSGQIVGLFGDATGQHSFLDTSGSFTTIDVPGAMITYPNGINDSGQVAGVFFDGLGEHGFVDTSGSFQNLPKGTTVRILVVNRLKTGYFAGPTQALISGR